MLAYMGLDELHAPCSFPIARMVAYVFPDVIKEEYRR